MNTPAGSKAGALGRVGRYVLRQEIASGGMATVYLAHLQGPHGFEKAVAIKRIHPHLVKDRRFVEMFLDEARVAALIHHPNVCSVVDFGEDEGTPYLVMEYLSGESFWDVMKLVQQDESPSLHWLSARVIHDAARGLHVAHELRGPDGEPLHVVHRDVSPQNVFVLDDGITKVVDFGVARARGRLTVTRTNEVKGKLPYMSPEQFDNEHVDRRTDLWALGVVLWEASVGRRLFRGHNDGATIARVLQKPIPRPSDFAPDYPARLEGIVMRCLERDPARRYQTGDELADELEEFLYAFGKPAGASQVKKWMERTFAPQIAYRRSVLRGDVAEPPPGPAGDGTTLSSIRSRPLSLLEEDDDVPTDSPEPEKTRAEPARRFRPAAADARAEPPAAPTIQEPPRASEDAASTSSRGRATIAVVLAIALGAAFGLAWSRAHDARVQRERPAQVDVPEEPEHAEVTARPPEPPAAPALPAPEPPPPAEPTRPTSQPARVALRAPAPTPVAAPEPEPRPTPQPAPAPIAQADGRLSLIAIPTATARTGGRTLGSTPLQTSLPAGSHRIDLTTADGRTRSVTVRIESGETTRQRVEF